MRYAIYYAPEPGTRLHHLGASWLGRDAFGQGTAPKKSAFGAIVDEPARYGFHATLKAPFFPREGQNLPQLVVALDKFAENHSVVSSGRVVLREIEGFLALIADQQSQALNDLASSCVEYFEPFRRPPNDAELLRRRIAKLTERQNINLEKWGYPYVFEDFRFHMTLTRKLSAEEKSAIMPAAQKHFTEIIGRELIIDHLCIFQELHPQNVFTVEHCAKLEAGKLVPK